MALLMLLVVPAFTSINRGGDITKATYDVSGALQVARSYATSNNTYVWVGLCEEDASQKWVMIHIASFSRQHIPITIGPAEGRVVGRARSA